MISTQSALERFYSVIPAGGIGSRLWPLSRQGMPKQLLPLVGGKSLLRLAFERSLASVPAERVLVVTGAAYADVVAAELPELTAEQILGDGLDGHRKALAAEGGVVGVA